MPLTGIEQKVAKLKAKGLKHSAIAKELGVSESDISQTVSRMIKRIKDLQDTLNLLKELDIISDSSRVNFTEAGLEIVRRRRISAVRVPVRTKISRLSFIREYMKQKTQNDYTTWNVGLITTEFWLNDILGLTAPLKVKRALIKKPQRPIGDAVPYLGNEAFVAVQKGWDGLEIVPYFEWIGGPVDVTRT